LSCVISVYFYFISLEGMSYDTMACHIGRSLRIQPPLIRSCYYVQNARTDRRSLSSRFAIVAGANEAAAFAGYIGRGGVKKGVQCTYL